MEGIMRIKDESKLDYIKRLTIGKKEGVYDIDYIEWYKLCFDKTVSSHEGRKRFYGVLELLSVLDNREIVDDEKIKVLILNDLHIPYQHKNILDEIKKYKDVDFIIFGGDIIDCESCSSFDMLNRPSVEEELVATHDFLCSVNEIVNPKKTKIIAIRGNHELRYSREIMKMHQKQLQKMLNPNLLSMLSTGFTYYEKHREITYKGIDNFEYIDDWKIKLFDNLIVCHPTDFSAVDGKMAEKVSEHFLNRHMAEPDDVIVFGHTHKHSRMNVNRRQGVYVIENFCMCQPMAYADSGRLGYNPQNYGYTYLEFKLGEKINPNDIKCVHLE